MVSSRSSSSNMRDKKMRKERKKMRVGLDKSADCESSGRCRRMLE